MRRQKEDLITSARQKSWKGSFDAPLLDPQVLFFFAPIRRIDCRKRKNLIALTRKVPTLSACSAVGLFDIYENLSALKKGGGAWSVYFLTSLITSLSKGTPTESHIKCYYIENWLRPSSCCGLWRSYRSTEPILTVRLGCLCWARGWAGDRRGSLLVSSRDRLFEWKIYRFRSRYSWDRLGIELYIGNTERKVSV